MQTATAAAPTIARKLNRWELDHLRNLVAEQQRQIDSLNRDLEVSQQHLEFWHNEAMREWEDAIPPTIGITQSCELLVLARGAA